ASRMVRDKLAEEIAALDGVEAAIAWAGRSLATKNNLTSEDAAIVEAVFRERMQVVQPEFYSIAFAASEVPSRSLGPQSERGGLVDPSSSSGCAQSATEHRFAGPRKSRRCLPKAPALPRQRPFALYYASAVHSVRSTALRGPSHPVRTAERTWSSS